jgi:putative SOS response-associated peptidase YedK
VITHVGGRYQLTLSWDDVASTFGLLRDGAPPPAPPRWKGPRWNCAPRQSVAVVRRGDDGREGLTMRWGYPPMWVRSRGKEPFDEPPLINARAEDALTKRTWARSLRKRRCLVPTTGFYEWVKRGKERFPLLLRPTQPAAFAGIWCGFDWGDKIDWPCMAFLTVAPNADVRPVHDRMPAMLTADEWGRWLDPALAETTIAELLRPVPDGFFESIEVGTALNSWSAEEAETQVADWAWEEGRG